MFLDDLSSGMIPYDSGISVDAGEGVNDADRHLLARALDPEGIARGLTDALRSFLSQLTYTVVLFGRSAYEVAITTVNGEPRPVSFSLEAIHPGTLVTRPWRVRQELPPAVADHVGSGSIALDRPSLLIVRPQVRFRRLFRKVVSELNVASRSQMERTNLFGTANYDPSDHHRLEELAAARAVRSTGWDMRRELLEVRPELPPYVALRRLRWYEFRAQLRDELLARVNAGLVNTQGRVGRTYALSCQGGSTASDINEARIEIARGGTDPLELVRRFS
jgi:hypothetical protein